MDQADQDQADQRYQVEHLQAWQTFGWIRLASTLPTFALADLRMDQAGQ